MNAYEAGHREPVDEQALEELDLYANNTAELYPQKQAILRNIERRIKNGSYDPSLAPKLWLYWVDQSSAKMYADEFAERREWSRIFSPATREALAKRLARREYNELMLQRELRPGQTERVRAVFGEPAGREHGRPWPRPVAREDAGPNGALDWKQSGDTWVAATFGGATYKLVSEGDDRWHTWYQHGGHKEDLGVHGNLGAAMGAARRHQPRMSKAAEESPRGDGYRGKRTSIVVAIYGAAPGDWVRGGALYGASSDLARARDDKFWLPLRLEHEPHALFMATNVPESLAKQVEAQGIHGEQHFDDGYKALDAVAPYLDKEPFYESPEEWSKSDGDDSSRTGEKAGAARRHQPRMRTAAEDAAEHGVYIQSLNDVRTWAANQGGMTSAEQETLTDAIHSDGDKRPAWGRDWSRYLSGIDIPATVLAGEIVMLRGADKAGEDDQIYTHKGIGYELQKRFQGGRPGWVYVVHFDKGRRTSHIHYDTKAEARSAAKSVIDDGWASGEVREAGERVPVIHEQEPEIVGASVTTTETATVVMAQEDFSTVSQAEQHAYTVGARFIAPFGKRKYYVFTPRKSGGYDKRLMFHKAGKWHISADKVIAQRLSRDSRAIRVSQTAKTIVREEAGHGEILDVDALAHRAKAAHDGSIMWVEFLPGDQGKDWGYTRDSKKAVPLSPHWQRRFKRYMESVNDGAVFIPAFKGSNEGVRASAREMSDKDRRRKVVGYVGDVSWIEYGGGPIYRTKYGYVLEYLEPSDEEGGQTTIYRVDLDPSVPTWGDIDAVADSSGQDVEDLRKAFTSEDPFDRAYAYQAWAGHYGWHEFDNYPLTLSPSEINKRYFGTMQALKKLKRPHGYRWSASEARRSRRGVREARGRERLVVRLMNEAEARSLRNRLDATTKGYSDRMGSSVWTNASRDEIEAALSHLGYAGTATIEKDTGGKADERRRGRAREQTHTFKKGDEVRWSDAMLAKGKDIDPRWYETQKDARGVVDHVQRDGDVLVYWNGDTETNVHPPTRLTLVKPAPEGHVYTGPRPRAREHGDRGTLYDQIKVRDRVTIVDRFGKEHTGRAVMLGPAGWVLNMGGKHGTPAIASPENVTRVAKAKAVEGKPKSRASEASSHKLDTFCLAYVEAALWSSTDESRPDGGDPLDKNYSIKDIDSETLDAMRQDCADFQEQNEKLLAEAYDHARPRVAAREKYDASYAGHDLWLSRNGHGAGYFDRNLGDVGERLQDAARALGNFDLYVGDDGKIHGSPLRKHGREASESPKKTKEAKGDDDPSCESTDGACVAIIERAPGCVPTGIPMETPKDVYDFLAPRYAKLGSEHFFVLLVSNQGELLGAPIEIARGQADRVAVDIEQIVAAAITGAAAGARGFIVSHCHPSGGEYARPSSADKRLTQDIRDSARIACPSTAFIDHVVIAPPSSKGVGTYYSFEDKKVVKVSAPN